MLRSLFIAALSIAAAIAPACQPNPAPAPINAVVTIAPLKGLIEPFLPPGSKVTVLMQPGRSEHGYEFTPSDMAAMARADVFVFVGLHLEGPIEAALAKQKEPRRRVVCFADAVGIKPTADQDDDSHASLDSHSSHDPHDHHADNYVDPHLWLDPSLVARLVPAVKDAVLAAEKAAGVDANFETKRLDTAAADLMKQVQAVDKDWADKLAPLKNTPIVTHHDAFSRPAARYGLKIAAVIREFETSEPTPGDIQNVVKAIREQNVRAIFVEPQFSPVAAERIAKAANVKLGTLDPLGDGDWFAMMKSNLDSLVKNLSPEPQAESPKAK